MRFIPAILILSSFVIICIGAYLKSKNYAIGTVLIVGGLIGEGIFILLNRYIIHKSNKQ